MNPIEQDIWKNCLTGFQLRRGMNGMYMFITFKFKGEFKHNSPVYHIFFFGKHHIHYKDHKGWVVENEIKFTEREQKDNDPRFPKKFRYGFFQPAGTRKTAELFFSQIRQKLIGKTEPSDKVIQLLKQSFPLHIPIELIYIICSNLLKMELEWLGKLLTLEELEEEE